MESLTQVAPAALRPRRASQQLAQHRPFQRRYDHGYPASNLRDTCLSSGSMVGNSWPATRATPAVPAALWPRTAGQHLAPHRPSQRRYSHEELSATRATQAVPVAPRPRRISQQLAQHMCIQWRYGHGQLASNLRNTGLTSGSMVGNSRPATRATLAAPTALWPQTVGQ